MARTPKPSVRYYLPKGARADEDQMVKLRGVASYNRKRLNFTAYVESWGVGIFVGVIDPSGIYTPSPIYPEGCDEDKQAKEISAYLCRLKDFVLQVIEKAITANAWSSMTSADLETLLHFYETYYLKGAVLDNATEIFAEGGIFDKWLKAIKAKEGAEQ